MSVRARVVGMTLALAAVAFASGCQEEDEDLTHGFVKVELRPADNADSTVFSPTAQINISMHYGECLTDFYAMNPNWRSDGVDGGPVFAGRDLDGEGWKDRLCENTGGEAADCQVTEILQLLEQIPQMRVTYSISNTELEGRYLRYGPLPTEALAACEGGQGALVRVAPVPVVGSDGGGNTIWVTKSVFPTDAETNQGQAVVARVGPPG